MDPSPPAGLWGPVAAFLGMRVRSFRDYGAALDWLSEADRGRPGESAE